MNYCIQEFEMGKMGQFTPRISAHSNWAAKESNETSGVTNTNTPISSSTIIVLCRIGVEARESQDSDSDT